MAVIVLREHRGLSLRSLRTTSLRNSHLELLLRTTSAVLASGIPPRHAAALLPSMLPSVFGPSLATLSEALEEGGTLTEAIDRATGGLAPDIRGVLEAGEESGAVQTALAALSDELSARTALHKQLLSAVTYPLFLLSVTIGFLIFLTSLILPRLAELQGPSRTLPPLASALMWSTGPLRLALPALLVFALVVTTLYAAALRRPATRLSFHRVLLRTPLLGPLRHSLAAIRVSSIITLSLRAGRNEAVALALAQRACPDAAVASRLESASHLLAQGDPLSTCLERTQTLPPVFCRLVRLGETTGSLVDLLAQGTAFERTTAFQTLARLLNLLQPIMIVIVGGLIGTVAVAFLQALYSLRLQ